jgi:hypothetical protein
MRTVTQPVSDRAMAHPDARRRVLIAVSPPLLGELIARRLDRDALEVLLEPATDRRQSASDVDVFVTTVPPSAEVHAHAVLLLTTTESGPNVGTECAVHTATSDARVPVRDMADIVALIDALTSPDEIHQS